jgi:putative endonuclease
MDAPWFVHIIQSDLDGSYYVGSTHDIQWRLWRHNDGWSPSTKSKRPWRVVYTEEYPTRHETLVREMAIKRMKSRRYIERLVAGGRPDAVPQEWPYSGIGKSRLLGIPSTRQMEEPEYC